MSCVTTRLTAKFLNVLLCITISFFFADTLPAASDISFVTPADAIRRIDCKELGQSQVRSSSTFEICRPRVHISALGSLADIKAAIGLFHFVPGSDIAGREGRPETVLNPNIRSREPWGPTKFNGRLYGIPITAADETRQSGTRIPNNMTRMSQA